MGLLSSVFGTKGYTHDLILQMIYDEVFYPLIIITQANCYLHVRQVDKGFLHKPIVTSTRGG